MEEKKNTVNLEDILTGIIQMEAEGEKKVKKLHQYRLINPWYTRE